MYEIPVANGALTNSNQCGSVLSCPEINKGYAFLISRVY